MESREGIPMVHCVWYVLDGCLGLTNRSHTSTCVILLCLSTHSKHSTLCCVCDGSVLCCIVPNILHYNECDGSVLVGSFYAYHTAQCMCNLCALLGYFCTQTYHTLPIYVQAPCFDWCHHDCTLWPSRQCFCIVGHYCLRNMPVPVQRPKLKVS